MQLLNLQLCWLVFQAASLKQICPLPHFTAFGGSNNLWIWDLLLEHCTSNLKRTGKQSVAVGCEIFHWTIHELAVILTKLGILILLRSTSGNYDSITTEVYDLVLWFHKIIMLHERTIFIVSYVHSGLSCVLGIRFLPQGKLLVLCPILWSSSFYHDPYTTVN